MRNLLFFPFFGCLYCAASGHAIAGEVMQDACDAEVGFPSSFGGAPWSPGAMVLKRAPDGFSPWTPPFHVQLDGDGFMRWWCHSTTGDWLDAGTWWTLHFETIPNVTCMIPASKPPLHPGAPVACAKMQLIALWGVDGWTAERSRCSDRSTVIRARLTSEVVFGHSGPSRLETECLGNVGAAPAPTIAKIIVKPSSLLDSSGEMHLFAVGEDGFVWTAISKPGQAWAAWGKVPGGIFNQGTTASSLLDSSGDMHLFAVGEDGRVYTTFSKPGQAWAGWGNVSTGVFSQGTTVSSLLDSGGDAHGDTHLFAVGEDGRVYTAFAKPGQAWVGWGNVSTGVFTH